MSIIATCPSCGKPVVRGERTISKPAQWNPIVHAQWRCEGCARIFDRETGRWDVLRIWREALIRAQLIRWKQSLLQRFGA